MPPALLDTDTLSEVMKGQDPQVQRRACQYLASYGRFSFSIPLVLCLIAGGDLQDICGVINQGAKALQETEIQQTLDSGDLGDVVADDINGFSSELRQFDAFDGDEWGLDDPVGRHDGHSSLRDGWIVADILGHIPGDDSIDSAGVQDHVNLSDTGRTVDPHPSEDDGNLELDPPHRITA